MSITHVQDPKHDPKFVPPAAALKVVGLTVAQVKTDESLFDLISVNGQQIRLLDDQIAVAIYIFCQRGWTYEALIPKTGMSERDLKRKNVEGMAILRTKEVTRTVAAIRSGSLSKKVVDEITSKAVDPEDKIVDLEKAAVKAALGSYLTPDGRPASDTTDVDALYERLVLVVDNNAKPLTGQNLVNSIPQLSEETGFKVKETKRSTEPSGGTNTALPLAEALKKALSDALRIERESEEAYVPSVHDIAAFLNLAGFIESRMPLGSVEVLVTPALEVEVAKLNAGAE